MENSNVKRKKILALSLDGGGMKGYISCYLLAELEKRTGKKTHELFKFIGGTSIGGILAALLASGMSAQDCLSFFTEDGAIIFKKSWITKFNIYPKYKAEVIEKVLKEKLGNKKLKDSLTKLLITSDDITTGKPFFFKSYSGRNYKLREAARATSAAQTYFPLVCLDKKILMDGGNVANNPALCMWADLHKEGYLDKNIKILSLGCGFYLSQENWNKYIHGNVFEMLLLTFKILFESGSEDVDYTLKHILGKNYCRVNPQLANDLSIDGADKKSLDNLKQSAIVASKKYIRKIHKFIL